MWDTVRKLFRGRITEQNRRKEETGNGHPTQALDAPMGEGEQNKRKKRKK